MPRIGVTITDQMEQALKAESERTHIPLSSLVRLAVADLLQERGWEINGDVSWGGYRERDAKQETEDTPS